METSLGIRAHKPWNSPEWKIQEEEPGQYESTRNDYDEYTKDFDLEIVGGEEQENQMMSPSPEKITDVET